MQSSMKIIQNKQQIKSITESLACDNCAQLHYNQLTEACYQYKYNFSRIN
jgi:hypothetical protein